MLVHTLGASILWQVTGNAFGWRGHGRELSNLLTLISLKPSPSPVTISHHYHLPSLSPSPITISHYRLPPSPITISHHHHLSLPPPITISHHHHWGLFTVYSKILKVWHTILLARAWQNNRTTNTSSLFPAVWYLPGDACHQIVAAHLVFFEVLHVRVRNLRKKLHNY